MFFKLHKFDGVNIFNHILSICTISYGLFYLFGFLLYMNQATRFNSLCETEMLHYPTVSVLIEKGWSGIIFWRLSSLIILPQSFILQLIMATYFNRQLSKLIKSRARDDCSGLKITFLSLLKTNCIPTLISLSIFESCCLFVMSSVPSYGYTLLRPERVEIHAKFAYIGMQSSCLSLVVATIYHVTLLYFRACHHQKTRLILLIRVIVCVLWIVPLYALPFILNDCNYIGSIVFPVTEYFINCCIFASHMINGYHSSTLIYVILKSEQISQNCSKNKIQN